MAVKKSTKLLNLAHPPSLKSILKKCSSFGKKNDGYEQLVSEDAPNDVPKGHFVVYVGEQRSRHVVPLAWLDHPVFKVLLRKSEEEFGYNQNMGLTIPCDEAVFLSLTEVLR